MKQRNRMRRALPSALLCLAGLALAAAAGAQADFELAADPGALVAEYREEIGGLAGPQGVRSVRIHAGGHVEVRIPAYMKGAGDYEAELTPAELRSFVAELIRLGLADFDPERARAALRQAQKASAELFESSDPSISEFRLELAGYTRPGAVRRPLQQKVRWSGLRQHAERHPGLKEVRGLAEAQRRFEAWFEHPGLRRAAPEEAR